MSENLFYVRSGMESSMMSRVSIYNCSIIQSNPNYYSQSAAITTIKNRILYSITGIDYDGAKNQLACNYRNLMTNDSSVLSGPSAYTSQTTGNHTLLGLLADDRFMYVSYGDSAMIAKLPIPDFNSNQYVPDNIHEYGYDVQNTFKAYGKMVWLNDHTICCAYENGFVFFDTITGIFENHQSAITITILDFAIGEQNIVATDANSGLLLIYNIANQTFSTLTLTSSNPPVIDYYNHHFYLAQKQLVTKIAESTMTTVDTFAAPWSIQPRQILVGDRVLFVIPVSSVRIYAMDFETEEFMLQMIPFQIPGWNGIPFTCSVFQNILLIVFGGYEYMLKYRGISTYQMGPVRSKEVVSIPKHSADFTYDENFIKFDTNTNSFAFITNGNISKEFQYTDLSNTVKAVSVNKSEYRTIISTMTTEKTHPENYIILTNRYDPSVYELFENYQDMFDWVYNNQTGRDGDIDLVIGSNISTTTPSFSNIQYRIGGVEFNNPITEIPNGTFNNCYYLDHVRIPSTCKRIGTSAFYNASNYTSDFDINLSASNVETIDSAAFMNVRIRGVLTLPPSLISISSSAFQMLYYITKIVIGDNCTSLGYSVFYGCSAVTEVEIGSSIQSIGGGTFANCSDLEKITLHVPENAVTGAPWNAPNNPQIIWDP